jgi:hypothetical protein
MGAFKDLQIFIDSMYPHKTKRTRVTNEVNEHIQGRLEFGKLSKDSQEVMERWEHYEMLKRG